MSKRKNTDRSVDIHKLLLEASQKKRKERRSQLLQSVGVNDYFEEGNITINMKTCIGVECKLCTQACPTNALFWKAGEIGIVEDLCVFCAACVLSCIVDDCIQVTRKRANGEIEKFSCPSDVLRLLRHINSRKMIDRVQSLFPTPEAYIKWYGR